MFTDRSETDPCQFAVSLREDGRALVVCLMAGVFDAQVFNEDPLRHGTGLAEIVTIVERRSGLVRIGKLHRITKEQTGKRTIRLLLSDKHRVKTITADNGAEFHGYRRIECALETSVYFATPHQAWERGTNENTNGLIRQYLPKGTPLDELTQSTCTQIGTQIANTLNNRPRKRLGYKTPNEVFHQLPIVALQT